MDKSSASTDGAQAATHPIADDVPNTQLDMPTTTTTTATASSQMSKQSSTTNSLRHSPVASRDASPSRRPRRTTLAHPSGNASRSRRNSQQGLSPVRQANSTPAESASSTLSVAAAPSLRLAGKEPPILSPSPQKPQTVQGSLPVSPTLPSPPPQSSKLGVTSARRSQPHDPPLISIHRPSPSSQQPDSLHNSSENDSDDSHMQPGTRTPVRGALETVQEVSQNNSPAHAADASLLEHLNGKLAAPDNHSDSALGDGGRARKTKTCTMAGPPGSGDAGGTRAESRRPSSVPPPPTLLSRQSSALSAKQLKAKPEGSTQNMTVETETVPSVPQVVLATGTKTEVGNGTLKTKPSAETIRPKKDKKKSMRKQPAVNSGTASSKADIFEAKIANAVDEANTSDSEETFVYDSNPPDKSERSTRRFHSRTPSATSMVSQAERPNLRSIYGVLEGGSHGHAHGPAPKKSMKFVNTFGGNASDSLTPGDDDGKGTGRSTGGSARGTLRHHHHIGRWGRQLGNGHASLFDNESPFPNAAKSKLAGNTSRNSSGPTSPRNYLSARGQIGTKRSAMQMSSYDLDDATGANDERTPLIETARSLRGSRSRRGPNSLRQAESQTYTRRSSYLNRFAACLVLTMMFLLVITGAIGFMFATSQPMTGIEIVSIGNVVTSEQVLMYDLTVKAHNPNIVVVTIDRANLEIFAKSEYADEDATRRKLRLDDTGGLYARDDPANDPPLGPGDGDGDNRPNLLLGRIAAFDSSLTFEGSLFHQGTSSSTGQMQLPSPGNNTVDGSARWSKIYQHEFDLIVKGVVKYSLPLSAHVRSETVSGRTTVKPNSANNPSPKPNITASEGP